MLEFICELGSKFYRQGRYSEALVEFKKALLLMPDYKPAVKYIQMIQESGLEKVESAISYSPQGLSAGRSSAIKDYLDLLQIQREVILERQSIPYKSTVIPKKAIYAPRVLYLNSESLAKILQPIEIEKDTSIILIGNNIQRFLVTQPDIVYVEKKNQDELIVTGRGTGYTYLHVWDNNGRWTTEWLGMLPKPKGPTYEEMIRKEEERSRIFKLRYTFDWSSFLTGKG